MCIVHDVVLRNFSLFREADSGSESVYLASIARQISNLIDLSTNSKKKTILSQKKRQYSAFNLVKEISQD